MEFMTTKEVTLKWNIKNIHELVLKGIDNDDAGKYKDENIKIKGATHIP